MTRKELINEYKNTKFRMGVFQIRNTVNHKIYIESSPNLDKIWNRHRLELEFGNHRNTGLQKDWKEYGEQNFVYEILAEIEQPEDSHLDVNKELKLLEQMYLEELQPYDDKGYHNRPRK